MVTRILKPCPVTTSRSLLYNHQREQRLIKLASEAIECSYLGIGGILEPVDMPFNMGVDLVEGGIREFVDGTDGPAFLERELVGLGVDGYW